MLVDLRLKGRTVVVLGRGEPARSRARMLTREGARVTRMTEPGTRAKSMQRRKGRLSPSRSGDPLSRVRAIRPAIVFSTSRDDALNARIVRAAHSVGALVHVYDAPALSDFILPSVGAAGSIHVAVSTSGQSPAMAALLRRRLERHIRPVDVEQVRLLGNLRTTLRRSVPTFEARRAAVYRILRSREIANELRAGRYARALELARKVIRASAAGARRA